jgi:hypothetical protein
VGGSKKLTAAVWLVPAIATVSVIFDKLGIGLEITDMFFGTLKPIIYTYFGGQSAVDITKEVREFTQSRMLKLKEGIPGKVEIRGTEQPEGVKP